MKEPRELIAAYLNDTQTDAERQELAAWLKASPDHLREFVEANLFDQELRRTVRGRVQGEAAVPFAETERRPKPGRSSPRFSLYFWPRWALVSLGVAAAVVLAGWFERREHQAIQNLAQVVRTHSVQVPSQVASYHARQTLGPGRLTLLAGVMEIALQNGVSVVFEGPGEIELLNPMRALLHSGQAVVRVPERARGFQLQTATAQVVDLGTEFGVKCGPGGSSEVVVFDGKVIASASEGSAAFPRQLTAGTAARFAHDQPNPAPIAYRPERFVRKLPADKPVELDEPSSLLFNPARYEEMAVSQPKQPLTIDGDLSDWDNSHSIRSARNGSSTEFIEGRMRYDEGFLYIAAHIGDPAPMRNVVDPATDGELGWRGGGLQLRLATDPGLGWPAEGNAADYYSLRRMTADAAQVSKATNSHLVHLTMWHYAPLGQACLHLAFGMDFHGSQVNPPGYRAAYRKDADGRGYTLEYAIPWAMLNAPRALRAGDTLAMSWTAHWSDEGGRLWRGQWVELRNAAEPLRIHTWERAATWGKAVVFQ